jgi:hypothetical protein
MQSRRDHGPVRTDDELRERWKEIVAAETFRERTLWLTWYDPDGQMLPVVVPVDDLPPHPHGEVLDGLAQVVGSVLDGQAPGGSVAMLISRPGPPSVQGEDQAWARALTSRAAPGVRTRPLHLATSGSVRVLVADGP